MVSSWGWPLGDTSLASETALPERERERQRESDIYIYIERERDRNLASVTALPQIEIERERQELGFCNSTARERETGTWLL